MKKKSYHHYCNCAHPCMRFSKKSIQDWKCHFKEFVKLKQKGKGIIPFCELGLTIDQYVSQKSGARSWNLKSNCREMETNCTKLEHFVNVHQITFERTHKMRRPIKGCVFVFCFSYKRLDKI